MTAAVGRLEWRQIPPLPDPCGFASPFVGVANGALVVAGGANFPEKQLWEGGRKVWHDQIYVLHPGQDRWEKCGRLPLPLGYGASGSADEGLLMAGGGNAEIHTTTVRRLQLDGGKPAWKELPSLPRPLGMTTGTLVGRTFYVAGGLESPRSKEALAVAYALDLDHLERGWTALPPWPGPGRAQAVAAAYDGYFYLFSGVRYVEQARGVFAMAYLTDAYRYSPVTGWERLPDLPHSALAAATPAPAARGEIFLVGGADGATQSVPAEDFPLVPQRIQAYDVAARTWRTAGYAPAGRVCVSTARWNDAWILPSGERSAGVRSPEVWQLHLR